MATMNISLPSELARQVEDLVATGRYGTASEVVRAALRSLLEREVKLEVLRKDVQAGLDNVDAFGSEPLDVEQFIAEEEARSARAKRESA